MRKIQLLKLNITVLRNTFTAHIAGIYSKKMTLNTTDRAISPITTIFGASWASDLPEEPIEIGSLKVDNAPYSQVNALVDLYTASSAFYYDYSTQTLYISLADWTNPIISTTFGTGETIGFLDNAQMVDINGFKFPLDTEVGGVNYEARLQDADSTESTDDQKNGIFVFDELSASFTNADGKYDTARNDITGNLAEILIADLSDSPEEAVATGFPYKDKAEATDFKLVRQGLVDDISYTNPESPTVSAIDPRADWTQKIGTNLLTVAEFPNLPEKYINKRKQICIGDIKGVNCLALRSDSTAADFDYHICDTSHGTIQSISSVYFNGQLDTGSGSTEVDRYLLVSEYSVNLSTGIITIANCIKGTVWVYGTFTTMSETVAIILYVLDKYANLPYLSSNFNQTEIAKIKALGYTTHVYIDEKGKDLNQIIEKLVLDAQIDFFQQQGVYTMRQANEQRTVTETIESYQLFDNPPPWDDSRVQSIKTIAVTYGYDYRQKIGDLYYDESKQTQALLDNRKAIDETFSVNLTNATQVNSIYSEYYTRFVKLARVVTLNLTKPFTAGLTDFVSFPITRKGFGIGSKTEITEELKTITTGEQKTITTGVEKAIAIANVIKIPVPTEKIIFVNAVYKIIEINKGNNTAKVVYFADIPDRGLIVEWSATPSDIYEWSATPDYILEGNT